MPATATTRVYPQVLETAIYQMALDELKAFLKDRIGKHEMVQAMELRDALLKTPVGKLSKRELIDEEARKRSAWVAGRKARRL